MTEGGTEIEIERSDDDSGSDTDTTDSNDVSALYSWARLFKTNDFVS